MSANGQRRTRRATNFGLAAPDEDVKQFCSPNLRISESNGYRQEQKVQFVVDAVYAMAHALHKAWSHLCDAQPGVVCEALKELNGGEFYTKYLLNVSFKDLAGSEVKFDEHGDGLGRYNIYNFRQVRQQQPQPTGAQANDSIGGELELLTGAEGGPANTQTTIDKLEGVSRYQSAGKSAASSSDGGGGGGGGGGVAEMAAPSAILEHIYTSNVEFEYSSVGRWTEDDYNLAIDQIQFLQGDHIVPESYCSRPCELGQAKMMRAGDHCCWICKTCQPYEYLPDEFNCQDCGIGRWPVPNKTSCYDLPQKYLRWDSVYSIISLCVACLGIALTLFVSIIFVKYIDTPVVKASGRELSFILLTGVAICHLTTFILLSKPTFIVCAGQRFLVNFGFALMYGSLLVKTNRISRIFNCARKSAKRPSFISPKSQMLITGILVGIQIFLTIVWFVFEPPGVRADSPEGKRDEVILKCRTKGRSFILSLVYNMILITTCTVYAVKTRKIPENFNESKFIGFTMYTTIVIWLAFVTMFFGTNNSYEIQMNTMCVCISLSAYVTLFCLFSPKISIILLHPDKNVRKLTMNSATYKRAFKPVSSVASVEGRNNLPPSGGSQPDAASGGPISTTSNVLNLDTQTIRLQESSVVSNVGNSNSAGSNCSQKTPTTLSQQLALVGICSNCGAHQLTAMPAISSVPNVASCSGSMASARENNRQTLGSKFNNRSTGATEPKGTSARMHQHQSLQQQQGQASLAGRQYQMNDKNSHNLVSSARLASSRSPNQTMTTAKVLHNRIVTAGETSGRSSGPKQPVASIKRGQTDDNVQVDLHHPHPHAHHHNHNQRNSALGSQCALTGAGSSHSQSICDEGARHTSSQQQQLQKRQEKHADNRRHMGSLNRLNEMTSFTSSERHCIDESISSLVNDSFMNTSLENTPCNAANGHLSSAGAHRHLAECKGSDSMLYNQSLQSIDYCSDCCPSLCHCSCPICSSSANEGAIFENNGADREGAHSLRAHRHNSISVTGTRLAADQQEATCDRAAEYDAMCILQLVDAHADCQEASANNNNLSSSMEAGDEQQQPPGARCHKKQVAPTAIRRARLSSHDNNDGDDGDDGDDDDDDDDDDEGLSSAQICTPHEQKQLMESGNRAGQHQAMLMQTFATKTSDDPANLQQSTSVVGGAARPDGGDGTSAKSSSSRSSRKRFSSSKQTGDQSAVYSALQAAASSALGVATTQIVRSASTSDRQHQLESSPQSGNSEKLHNSAIYQARESSNSQRNRRSRASRAETESQMAHSSGSGGGGGGGAGTIRASLELVKSSDARRRSIEASNRQRRKSGCFNYHDDYEYSYGLVHSDSESDRERFFDENQADSSLDIGFGLKHEREPSLGANIAESIRCAMLVGDGAANDGDDDDDFEHDGRVTLERRLSSRQAAQQTSLGGADSRRQTSLSRHKAHESSMTSSKRCNKELELDEHRINSVALIAATLSAGGAIVESGGATSSAATAAGVEQAPPPRAKSSDKSAASTSGSKAEGQQQISEQRSMNKQASASGAPGSQGGATYLGTF